MSIPGSVHPLFSLGKYQYEIKRSLRFNSADSAYCSKVFSSAGNQYTFTLSMWVKRSALGTVQWLWTNSSSTPYSTIGFDTTDQLYGNLRGTGGTNYFWYTNAVYRDPSGWYHIVAAWDTANVTPASRFRLYVNGVEQTFSSISYCPQNTIQLAADTRLIGAEVGRYYFNGYLADIHFIDGQALTPSSFGETDATTGAWNPKAFSGSYGTNGFHLDFADNSNNTATTLGKDTSGNSNNWTPNNFSVESTVNYNGGVTHDGTPDTTYTTGAVGSMFDGSTSTAFGVNNGATKKYISIDFTGKGLSVSSTFKVYATFRTGMVWKINGTTVSSSGVTHPNTGWQTLSGWSSGSVTSLYVEYPNNNACEIHAIEIDGVIITNKGAGNDSTVDSPTNYGTDTGVGGEVRGNYATLNPLDKANLTLSNGNLDLTHSGTTGNWQMVRATIGVSSGKWYWETTVTDTETILGIAKSAASIANDNYVGNDANGWSYNGINGQKINNGSGSAYGNSYTSGDVIGVAFDADAGNLYFYKNETVQNSGTAAFTSLTSGPYFPAFSIRDTGHTSSVNLGQRAFAYAAPANYKALCTANLPTPTIAKGSDYMDVVTWSGTGGGSGATRSLTGLGFSPDLVWQKARSSGTNHRLLDAVRGAGTGKTLSSNTTSAEGDGGSSESLYGYLSSFDSNGFTLTNGTSTFDNGNKSVDTYVAWAWDAGSSTVSNTSGSITSQVRANQSAGFSIVTWSYGSSNATVGHGLGVAPGMIIAKGRTSGLYGAGQWIVYHSGMGANQYIYLSATSAAGTNIPGVFDGNSSTVFEVDSGLFPADLDYVAYCFAPVSGYSSFGSYTGNGSSDGPFVFLGFRPALVMVKMSSSTGNWTILDDKREGYNVDNDPLFPNLSNIEGTTDLIDITSNGFKVRTTDATFNTNTGTYIYAAWASSPFAYARAR